MPPSPMTLTSVYLPPMTLPTSAFGRGRRAFGSPRGWNVAVGASSSDSAGPPGRPPESRSVVASYSAGPAA